MKKYFIIIYIVLFVNVASHAIADNENLNKQQVDYISAQIKGNKKSVMCTVKLTCGSSQITKFYADHNYNPVWIAKGQLTKAGASLVFKIRNSFLEGLNPRSYHVTEINTMITKLKNADINKSAKLLADLDVTLSDGFFLMVDHLSNGIVKADKVSRYLDLPKKNINFYDVADKAVKVSDVSEVLDTLSPANPMYASLKEKLFEYYKIATSGGFVPISSADKSGSKDETVKLIKQRLYTTGELAKIKNPTEYDKELEIAIMKFQHNNQLESDGMIGIQTLKALNTPVEMLIQKIALNMDRLRILPGQMASRHVIINIPDYSLEAFKDGKVNLVMPVVVGKAKSPSCILNSQITHLDFNPYWNVPNGIASNEIIPELRKNPGFLKENNMRVFKKDMKEVNPDEIDWSKVTAKGSVYRFRQDPGDLNALGKVKFAFPNKCVMYLHDSLAREVFEEQKRDLGHGCIRLGLPLNFAHYLLADNKGWDAQQIMETINESELKKVRLAKAVDLYILYQTVFVNTDGVLQFRNDIYNLDKLSPYPVWKVNGKDKQDKDKQDKEKASEDA
jgi:L,D-transpeptidase YcbB